MTKDSYPPGGLIAWGLLILGLLDMFLTKENYILLISMALIVSAMRNIAEWVVKELKETDSGTEY